MARQLDKQLDILYNQGYRRFLNGGALGFDLLAAERVLLLRQQHPDVQLVMVLPCPTQTQHWPEIACRRYEHVMLHTDEMRVLSPMYFNGCMMIRNRHMVDRSHICLCYLCKPKGGTMSTVAYACSQGLHMINLAMESASALRGNA